MFLPTRIEHIYERTPWATHGLIWLNAFVFFFVSKGSHAVHAGVALDPNALRAHQLVTHMFLHGDFWHLAGNLLYLFVYGKYLEDRLGPARFLALYGGTGLVAALFHLETGVRPAIGASGAITGLTGIVLVAAPWAQVRVIFWFHLIVSRTQMAAFWLLAPWLVLEFIYASQVNGFTGIAHWAHVGGMLAGCGAGALLRSDICRDTPWWLDPALPGGGQAAVRRLREARRRRRSDRSGAPSAQVPPPGVREVEFRSIEAAPSQVAIIKLLMRRVGLAPSVAQKRLAALTVERPWRFHFDTQGEAAQFETEARALGVTLTPARHSRRPAANRGIST